MNEKLGKGNIDELMEERQVHKFLNIENSKKNYKKEWYKKNSEIVKERQAKYYADNADEINMKRRRKHNPIKRNDRYDPKKQKESYDPIKRKADHENNDLASTECSLCRFAPQRPNMGPQGCHINW